MKKLVFAVIWLFVGVALTIVLVVDPLGIHPVDQWIWGAIHRGSDSHAHDDSRAPLHTCPMHPQILQEGPGSCSICGMNLVEVEDDFTIPADHAASSDGDHTVWTCPMHPQIIEKQPGDCPMCGMDLVASESETDTQEHTAGESRSDEGPTVRIDPVVVQNMNVTTEPAGRRDVIRRIRTVGSLEYDLEGMVTVTTRYSGFVEQVHVGNVGESVREGDPLFDVYAPDLVQTQKELLSAIRYAKSLANAPDEARHRAQELVKAARTRLEYWNLTGEQIRSIEEDGAVQRTITVFAPISGVIMERAHGLEGMAISPGMDVIHIADLSTLLLTVEVFESQLQWVSVGTNATVHLTYLGDRTLEGRVRFIEPEVLEQTRTVRLVVEVPNRRGRLRVGMFAEVEFQPVVASDAIVIPTQAVLRTGEREVVVIALGDGTFAPRQVELGLEGDDGYVQIVSGVSDDDVVVTSAQFLIDSESNLRAAISKMTATNHLGH